MGCFIGDGPHWVKDCLKCEKLNALVKKTKEKTLKLLLVEISVVLMYSLLLLNNKDVEVNYEPTDEEMLKSVL